MARLAASKVRGRHRIPVTRHTGTTRDGRGIAATPDFNGRAMAVDCTRNWFWHGFRDHACPAQRAISALLPLSRLWCFAGCGVFVRFPDGSLSLDVVNDADVVEARRAGAA
jgi:hypothetical protein